jgi:hypothetical protein
MINTPFEATQKVFDKVIAGQRRSQRSRNVRLYSVATHDSPTRSSRARPYASFSSLTPERSDIGRESRCTISAGNEVNCSSPRARYESQPDLTRVNAVVFQDAGEGGYDSDDSTDSSESEIDSGINTDSSSESDEWDSEPDTITEDSHEDSEPEEEHQLEKIGEYEDEREIRGETDISDGEDDEDVDDVAWSEKDSIVGLLTGIGLHRSNWGVSKAPRSLNFIDLSDGEVLLVKIGESAPQGEKFAVLTAYKPVHKKIRTIPALYPEDARTIRQRPEDPLQTLPELPRHSPVFEPTAKFTAARMKAIGIESNAYIWPEEQKLFQHVLAINERSIAWTDEERGTFLDTYLSPHIIPVVEHEPWQYRPLPIPKGREKEVVAILETKKKLGIYQASTSAYNSRIFCVMKKGKNEFRIVHDLQPMNAVTIRNAMVPPNIGEFVEEAAGRQIYTMLDMYSGFDGRKLDAQSRQMTAFQTPIGLLELSVMPQGAANSPGSFQEDMTFILEDEIPHKVSIFIDDVAVKGERTQYLTKEGEAEVLVENAGIRRFVWEHANDLHRVLHRLGRAGGTVSGKKIQAAQEKVMILGQICGPEGREPDDAKTKKIISWPTPANLREVRGFLGLCGTVRVWIKDYSKRARPLVRLTRKDVPFEWTEQCELAFVDLKDCLVSPPVLIPLDYECGRPIILSVDSSHIAMGYVLQQEDEQGRKRPARYGSVPFTKVEANYGQPKLELCGLAKAIRATRYYTSGRRFRVEVDASAIKGMLKNPDMCPDSIVNQWIHAILNHDFELVHVPGVRHKAPDALSRREPTNSELEESQPDIDDWSDEEFEGEWDEDAPKTDAYDQREMPSVLLADMENFKVKTKLEEIREYLELGRLPNVEDTRNRRRFFEQAGKYRVVNGKMYRLERGSEGSHVPKRVIHSPIERLRLMTEAHDELGHRGAHGVLETLRKRFYWPHMYQDVAHHVKSCHQCQIRSIAKSVIPPTIASPEAAIFHVVHLDVMLMPLGKYGMRYIIAARDSLTQAAEGRALAKNTSAEIARFLWEEVICRYGIVGKVITDNGPEVQGAFEVLVAKYGIPHAKISPYNSRANGVVERGHFVIREAIVKACEGEIYQWPDKVTHAFFADRVIARRSTGFSPHYLLHGVEPVLPFDLTEATYLTEGFRRGMSTVDLLALRIRQLEMRKEDLQRAADAIVKQRLASKEQFERRFAHQLTKREYQEGELVLVRNSRVERELNRKTKDRYLGPYEIVKKTKGGSYVIREMDGACLGRGIAAFRLLPYYPRGDLKLDRVPDEPEEESLEEENEIADNQAKREQTVAEIPDQDEDANGASVEDWTAIEPDEISADPEEEEDEEEECSDSSMTSMTGSGPSLTNHAYAAVLFALSRSHQPWVTRVNK